VSLNSPAPGIDVLGVRVSGWEVHSLIDAMLAAAGGLDGALSGGPATIHYANVHVLNTACGNPDLRAQLNKASTVYCDGAGVRLGARMLGATLPPRLTAADWIDPFCARAARSGSRIFLLGGERSVAESAAAVLRSRHEGLDVVGTHHGYLDPEASRLVVSKVNARRTQILLVGMGTPTQELWIARYRGEIAAPVVWSVGALFDFVSGAQRRAPGPMTSLGLEWLWRWVTDPRRLTTRYLIGNPLFVLRVLRQRWFDTGRTE
jgi:N-acetylglucosaminyldiphosphoundecaprenol N-acetyl-beta-D-mannosaminyltransferase